MKAFLECVQPVLMARDVGAAIAFYAQLGFELVFKDAAAPRYAVIRRDAAELHLQWQDASAWAHPGDRPTYRFVVTAVDELAAEFAMIPGLERTAVSNTRWGTREFHVRDLDGNGLQFYRSL